MSGINNSNLLDPSIGVQGVLAPAIQSARLPQAQALATDAATESGLADLYRSTNLQSRILSGLQPQVGDEALLRPDVMGRNLQASLERLADSRDPHVRRFVREDLKPLLENKQLLGEYINMLVSG
jgi:hypothetical protein